MPSTFCLRNKLELSSAVYAQIQAWAVLVSGGSRGNLFGSFETPDLQPTCLQANCLGVDILIIRLTKREQRLLLLIALLFFCRYCSLMITKLVTTGVFSPTKMIFRLISEVKVHVQGQISRQKYKFPAFFGKTTHAHTVCTRLLKGPEYEATVHHQ